MDEDVPGETALDPLAETFPSAHDTQRLFTTRQTGCDRQTGTGLDNLPADLARTPSLYLPELIVGRSLLLRENLSADQAVVNRGWHALTVRRAQLRSHRKIAAYRTTLRLIRRTGQ